MVNLPGSVLWLFLFVHLIHGQISDNIYTDKGSSVIVGHAWCGLCSVFILLGFLVSSPRISKCIQPKNTGDAQSTVNGTKPQGKKDEAGKENTELETKEEEERAPVGAHDGIDDRSKGRRVFYRAGSSNATVLPQMSPQRRRSYLSIAERRKYYNRTRTASTQRDVLLYQETTNRPSHERMLLMNEIREHRQNIAKDSTKGVTHVKNDTRNQRIVVGTNETLPKTDNVNQTVIYPLLEFGQKLRKTAGRAQDKQRRRKDKTKEDLALLNSTNKISKNIHTQSTKLVEVEGSHWSTTKNPKTEVETENLVMPWKRNKTNAEKAGKYVKSTSTEKVISVPLSIEQILDATTADATTTESEEAGATTEIFENTITTGGASVVTTVNATESTFKTTGTEPLAAAAAATTAKTTTTTTTTISTTTTLRPPLRKLYLPSVEYKSRFNYTRRPVFKPASFAGPLSSTTENEFKSTKTVTPQPPDPRKWSPSSTTAVPSTEAGTNTEEYPLTIEINENNKRVLSEMFRTTTELALPPKASTAGRIEPVTEKGSVPGGATAANASTTAEPEHFGDDHKPVGTSFNTKFYIIPNVTKTEVIKVVEADDDAENEVLVTAQTVGIAIYILAAFGLVPLLLALVFGTRFFVQRHRRKEDCDSDLRSDISAECRGGQRKGVSELKKSPSNVTTTTLVATTRLPRVHHWESYEKNKNWEFPRSKLKLLTVLGQGNFGQVWKAEAEDMPGQDGLTRLVAVKTVKEGATEKEQGELIKELEIMQQIGSHPNIVTLLGCCTEQEPYYLIMEYVMYGKLLTYLREHRTNENYYNISNNNDALTSRDLTVFAYCVARGMEYLASKGIIHRDLAARNVLVDHNKLCKIADFGMSRSVRDAENGQVYEERQHKGALPIRWMAPESLLYSLFTHKSDVWSFGIVMWEIVTLGSTPYPNMHAREVMRRVREGYRLERPPHCKHELYQLISHCWAHDPNRRPDFGELRRELANLLDDTSKDGIYVDLDSFAVSNRFHVPSAKTNDFRLLERNEFKTLKRLEDWEGQDWPMESRKIRSKRTRNNGKGTVTLTGHGSFTVNSRILEKEFKLV